MSDQAKPIGVGVGVAAGGGGLGVGMADLGGSGAVGDVVSVSVGAAILGFFGEITGLLGTALLGALSFLGEVIVGVFVGGVIVGGVGSLFLLLLGVVVEVRQRRGAQVPAHLRVVSPLAPRSLRWVRGLLPGDEGAAWLAEVTSCLAETNDKGERRRYVSSYRRGVPQLIWSSWTAHLGRSGSRTLS